jgi:hypothetical protein
MRYSRPLIQALKAKGYESISIHVDVTMQGEEQYRVDCMRTNGHHFYATFPTIKLVRQQLKALLGEDIIEQLKVEKV